MNQNKPEKIEKQPPTSSYDCKRIAWELKQIAEGRGYFGNALYVAKEFPFVKDKPEYQAVLHRYLMGSGVIRSTDHVTLQEIALTLQRQTETKQTGGITM